MITVPSCSTNSLIVCKVSAFGHMSPPGDTAFGTRLAHALTGDYVRHRRMSQSFGFADYRDVLGYVLTVMEDIDGFDSLTAPMRDSIMTDASEYLSAFIQYTERLVPDGVSPIAVVSTTEEQPFVAILI